MRVATARSTGWRSSAGCTRCIGCKKLSLTQLTSSSSSAACPSGDSEGVVGGTRVAAS